jgi:hypothetical protein
MCSQADLLGIIFDLLDCSYPKWTGSQITWYISDAIVEIIDHGSTEYGQDPKTDIWLRLSIYNDERSPTRTNTNKLVSMIRNSLAKSGFSFKIKSDMNL